MRIHASLIAGLALALVAPAVAQTPTSTVQAKPASLSKPRASLGMKALAKHPNGLIVKASGRQGGEEAQYELIFDADGRFRSSYTGAMNLTRGFDGTTCWERDWMNTPSTLALSSREETLSRAWMLSGLWATGERFDASMTARSETLGIHLAGGIMDADVEFDNKTGLPRQFTWSESGIEQRLELSDFRKVQGIHFPHRWESHHAGQVDWFEVDSVESAPAFVRSPFAAPAAGSSDTRFDTSVSSSVPVTKARTGHLMVKASVDGTEPKWFILDSGAGAMTIDKGFANELDLKGVGNVNAQGIGGIEKARFVESQSFQLGPMTISDPVFVEIDLGFLAVPFGVDEVAGIVGYGFFSRCSAMIDMELAELELYPPGEYTLRNGEWMPLVLSGRHPCIKARFEGGREELFKIDTGAAASSLAFHAPAVKRLGLLKGRETTTSSTGGVGGMLPIEVGQIEYFELAGHRFEHVDVGFATENKGAFADEYTAGNIGGDFLQPFQLVLDYPNQRIALVKRPLE